MTDYSVTIAWCKANNVKFAYVETYFGLRTIADVEHKCNYSKRGLEPKDTPTLTVPKEVVENLHQGIVNISFYKTGQIGAPFIDEDWQCPTEWWKEHGYS